MLQRSPECRAFQPIEPPRRRAARGSLLALVGFVGLAALVPLSRSRIPDLPAGLVSVEAFLCPLTGFAAWLVWRRIDVGLDRKRAALRRWGWFLLAGLWPGFIPLVSMPAFPSIALLLCLALGGWTALSFRKLHVNAGLLMLPYLIWIIASISIVTTRF